MRYTAATHLLAALSILNAHAVFADSTKNQPASAKTDANDTERRDDQTTTADPMADPHFGVRVGVSYQEPVIGLVAPTPNPANNDTPGATSVPPPAPAEVDYTPVASSVPFAEIFGYGLALRYTGKPSVGPDQSQSASNGQGSFSRTDLQYYLGSGPAHIGFEYFSSAYQGFRYNLGGIDPSTTDTAATSASNLRSDVEATEKRYSLVLLSTSPGFRMNSVDATTAFVNGGGLALYAKLFSDTSTIEGASSLIPADVQGQYGTAALTSSVRVSSYGLNLGGILAFGENSPRSPTGWTILLGLGLGGTGNSYALEQAGGGSLGSGSGSGYSGDMVLGAKLKFGERFFTGCFFQAGWTDSQTTKDLQIHYLDVSGLCETGVVIW